MAVVILVFSNKVDGRQMRISDVVEDSIRISLSVEIDVFKVMKFVYCSGYYGEASFRDLEKCWARIYIRNLLCWSLRAGLELFF